MDANSEAVHDKDQLLDHTATIVAAYAATNHMNEDALVSVLRRVFGELKSLGGPSEPVEAQRPLTPAVPIKKSVTSEYIVCLEDGAQVKLLKRYLMARYNMTPQQYRQKWGLPADYPMVAPAYAQRRSTMAKQLGLGRKPAKPEEAPAPAKPGRKPRAGG